jgi:hypothetical protein
MCQVKTAILCISLTKPIISPEILVNRSFTDGTLSAHPHLNRREVKNMMFASTAVVAFSIGIGALLMVANYMLWGLNNPRDLRRSSNVTPLGGREIVELALRRLVAAENAMVPRRPVLSSASQASADEAHDGGFKRVA